MKVRATEPGPHDQEDVVDLLGDSTEDLPGWEADAGDDHGLRRLQEGPPASQRVY